MSFAADVTKWCKQTAPEANRRVVRIAVAEIANRVIYRSPVGDAEYWEKPPPPGYAGGRFRGNWSYGFGSVPTDFSSAIDPSGASTLSRITGSIVDRAGVHYIANNLPYAQRIEDGWSERQAPFGVVALTELEFPEIFERARRQA